MSDALGFELPMGVGEPMQTTFALPVDDSDSAPRTLRGTQLSVEGEDKPSWRQPEGWAKNRDKARRGTDEVTS